MTGGMRARRRDEESDWHDVVSAACERCGCGCLVAEDDSSIVWDPGRAWDEACSDRGCDCHTDPVVGARRG